MATEEKQSQTKNWTEEIEIAGRGTIEICVYNRNDLMICGTIDGFEIDEFHVDKPCGAAHWGPGWLVRVGYAATPPKIRQRGFRR
jgi:hypothetical protein